MKDLLELNDVAGLIGNHLKKLDWLVFQLLENAVDDDVIIAELALDVIKTVRAEVENVNEHIGKLRQIDMSKDVDLEQVQKVA